MPLSISSISPDPPPHVFFRLHLNPLLHSQIFSSLSPLDPGLYPFLQDPSSVSSEAWELAHGESSLVGIESGSVRLFDCDERDGSGGAGGKLRNCSKACTRQLKKEGTYFGAGGPDKCRFPIIPGHMKWFFKFCDGGDYDGY
nr:hypothetical protein Iba_chr09cCG7630 [Ipomoea batatas]